MSDLSDPTALPYEVRDFKTAEGLAREGLAITHRLAEIIRKGYEALDDGTRGSGSPAFELLHGGMSELGQIQSIWSILSHGLPSTAELDGLRAQIEEALSSPSNSWLPNHAIGCDRLEWGYDGLEGERNDIECDCYLSIFAQSPRGTVARIQAEALEGAGDIRNQMGADEVDAHDVSREGQLPENSRIMLNGATRYKERLAARAAALREGAGR